MRLISQYLQSINIPTDKAADAENKFRVYRDFLIEQNKLFNLTAITDPQEIVTKHFIDSLAALPYIKGKVADIGTGAGFPGMVLAIVMQQNEFALIDSLNKRVNFLNELRDKLGLTNANAIHSRAEDLPKTRTYDTIVSRAVSRLNTLCEYCLPFVKTGGTFISYKSDDCEEEINEAKNAIKILGGKIEDVKQVNVFGTDIVRKLVLIKKIKETPQKYPRSQNKPKKQPL